MNSISSFLRKLRAKKEVADAGRKGAALGIDIGANHFELSERAQHTAAVFLAADVFGVGVPPEVLQELGKAAVAAAAARDQYFEIEKIQIATARHEAEKRDREGN
jgi:hypothetical protein